MPYEEEDMRRRIHVPYEEEDTCAIRISCHVSWDITFNKQICFSKCVFTRSVANVLLMCC